MGYLHINNLYKQKEILLFRECYASEKVYGTSAHIKYKKHQLTGCFDQELPEDKRITFFSGGVKYQNFVDLFDYNLLLEKFELLGREPVILYGEACGGKYQKMKDTTILFLS